MSAKTGHEPATTPRDPLAAVPVVLSGIEVRSGRDGLTQIRRPSRSRPGLGGWLERKLKIARPCRVNLDEIGTYVWKRIDGRTNLDAIAGRLSMRFDLEATEARQSVVSFTRTLMLRGIVGLENADTRRLLEESKRKEKICE